MSGHPFELELNQPTPRRVAARDGYALGCLLWVGRVLFVPHTVIGLVFVYRAVVTCVLNLGVLLAGEPAVGHVTAKSEHMNQKGMVSYWVEYVFTLDGAEYAGSVSPDADEYATVRENQPVAVWAWRPDPVAAHWRNLPGHSPRRDVLTAVGAALFWNAIVLLTWWWLAIRPWLQRRLIRYGVPAAGRVRDVTESQGKSNPHYRIRYDYPVEPDGRLRAGSRTLAYFSSDDDRKVVTDLKAGDTLTVLYDSRWPRQNLLYRFAHYRAVSP
jgi:hypothetical protein